MSKLVFWLHYNKPASASAKSPKLTIHYRNECHIVDHVLIEGPVVFSHHRKKQPRMILKGVCEGFEVRRSNNGLTAIIT